MNIDGLNERKLFFRNSLKLRRSLCEMKYKLDYIFCIHQNYIHHIANKTIANATKLI